MDDIYIRTRCSWHGAVPSKDQHRSAPNGDFGLSELSASPQMRIGFLLSRQGEARTFLDALIGVSQKHEPACLGAQFRRKPAVLNRSLRNRNLVMIILPSAHGYGNQREAKENVKQKKKKKKKKRTCLWQIDKIGLYFSAGVDAIGKDHGGDVAPNES